MRLRRQLVTLGFTLVAAACDSGIANDRRPSSVRGTSASTGGATSTLTSGGTSGNAAGTSQSSSGGSGAGSTTGHSNGRSGTSSSSHGATTTAGGASSAGSWHNADGGEPAAAADGFVESIGANVHLGFEGSPYTEGYASLKALLVASGIRHFRDGVIVGDPPYLARVRDLADAGLSADLITSVGQDAGVLVAFASQLQGAMEAVEAPNEYNQNGGTGWVSTLQTYLPALQQAIRDPAMQVQTVVGPSLTTESAYGAIGDISPLSTVGNLHCYFSGFMPETPGWGSTDKFGTYGALTTSLAWGAQAFGPLPIWITELGYGTQPTTHGQVPLDVQGKYLLRALFETFRLGVRRTYLYQFLDQGSAADGFGYYGLVAVDPADRTGTKIPFKPKPSYVALSSVLGKLADPGPSFEPRTSPLTFSGQSLSLRHLLFEKRDETFLLVFWLAQADWDPNVPNTKGPGGYLSVAPETFSLSVGQSVSLARLTTYDPATGTPAEQALDGSSGTLTLRATDTIQLLELKP